MTTTQMTTTQDKSTNLDFVIWNRKISVYVAKNRLHIFDNLTWKRLDSYHKDLLNVLAMDDIVNGVLENKND